MSFSLTDQQVIKSFHTLLQTSLAQAKAERLLDSDTLSSAEADLMISGPALCMYFAALRCTTSPPAVTLPRIDRSQPPVLLSPTNCPQTFIPMLRIWSGLVPRITELNPDHQHDLARVICGLEPISQPINPQLNRIAAELRSVAIEISQRRSFQEQYASDLQTALDSGEPRASSGHSKITASFRPPPSYDEASSAGSSSSPRSSPGHASAPLPSDLPAQASNRLSVSSATPAQHALPRRESPQRSSPSLAEMSAIETIRETLYAALADVIDDIPGIRALLASDPPHAYFASVALAILKVAQSNVSESGSVMGVMGTELTLADCPQPLRPLMSEIAAVAHQSHVIADEDDAMAMKLAAEGRTIPEPRLERVKKMLERGVGYEEQAQHRTSATEEGRRSVEGRSIQFTNRLNALALKLSTLPSFRERQDQVFQVLSATF